MKMRSNFVEVIEREKAGSNYIFDILGLPYGGHIHGRDHHGKFFSETTDFQTKVGDMIPAVYHHGKNPIGMREAVPEFYEKARLTHFDEKGGWFEVIVDKSKKYAARLASAARGGVLRASTGLAGTLARWKPNGMYTLWVPGELTLVNVGGPIKAANDLAIGSLRLKAIYEDLQIPWHEGLLEKAQPEPLMKIKKIKLEW